MDKYNEMKKFASEIRRETLKMLLHRGFGHLGGSLSIVEVLSVLYSNMDIDINNSKKQDRDYLVLSKGHAGPALYSTLAIKGFFNKEVLKTLNNNGTILPSHPDKNLTPGIDMTTGSLGQGISTASGIALGLKLREYNRNKVYCIVGDGELNEGQCWEAIQFVAHHQLENFILFIDNNKKQLDGTTKEICNPFSFKEKLLSFGFEVEEVDGKNVESIYNAVFKNTSNKPKCIILNTIKGQGSPYFEKLSANHHIRFTEEMKEILKQEIELLERGEF